MQPLENIADRMRQKRKSWYDGDGSPAEDDAPSRLLALPTELQFYVISYLGLSDLERLRRTCQYYRFLLSPEYVRALFGGQQGLASQLTGHCQDCLDTPGRNALILQSKNPPLSSKCFRCSVVDGELSVGAKVPLANAGKAWVCRWCGWPVTEAHSWASEQFHVGCHDRYYRVLWVFLFLGFAQFSAGIVAAALSLMYFRDELVVFAPTLVSCSLFIFSSVHVLSGVERTRSSQDLNPQVNFILLWVCMAFLMLRGNRIRTYHWVGIVELVIMALWIPPVYAVARDLERHSGSTAYARSVAALAFFAVNMYVVFERARATERRCREKIPC